MNRTEIQAEHEKTIKQLLKLKFITQILLECKPDREHLKNDSESMDSYALLRVTEYLNLNGNDNDSLLNVGDYCQNIKLSYTAQKNVREHLIKNLRLRLTSLGKFIWKMQLDLPHLFEAQTSTETTISSSCMKLINLEQQRRECLEKIGELKNQKIKLLKAVLDLKLGPQLRNELELLHGEMCINQTKANLMHSYMVNEFVTRSEHSVKAIKEVERFIDEQLNEIEEQQKEKS